MRALTVEGPTVLVFGWPDDACPELIAQLRETAGIVVADLREHTGHKVGWVVMPANVTIRTIKATVREKGAE